MNIFDQYLDRLKKILLDFSNKIKISINEIRYFLKTKMYNNKIVLKKNNKGKLIIKLQHSRL